MSAPDNWACRGCGSRAADYGTTCDDCGDHDKCGSCGWCKCEQGVRAFRAPKKEAKAPVKKKAKPKRSKKHKHDWIPVSFVFETQLLDREGRVIVRQPAPKDAHVYMVCLDCQHYTYMLFDWVGHYIGREQHPPEKPVAP